MSLRFKSILVLVLLGLVLSSLVFKLWIDNRPLLLLLEFFVLTFLVTSYHLYKIYVRPFELISKGIELIKERDFNTKFVQSGQKEYDRLITVYNQMIDQLRDERIKQKEQHFLLEKLIEASGVGIVLLDFESRITAFNSTATALTGYENKNVVGKSLNKINGALFKKIANLKDNQSVIFKKEDQKSIRLLKSQFIEKGFSRSFIILEEMTKELFQVEKKAYEKVIRMMSHEVNNSVAAVNSILNSFLTYQNQLTEDDREDYTDALQVAIERNKKLSDFMSASAEVVRIPTPQKEQHDLCEIVEDASKLIAANCRYRNIDLDTIIPSAPFYIHLDRQQFEQVLVNILKNAMEAIEENGSIEIAITSGNKGALIIRDSGKGIPTENQSHLFTPFYSTKKGGQGIGLTLAREILLNHGFKFSLMTLKSGLTEFKIIFE